MSSNMGVMFYYFVKIRTKYPEIDSVLKTILGRIRSPRQAICMTKIKKAYTQLTGQPFPMKCGALGVGEFLLTIPYVACYCNENGTLLFYTLDEFHE